MVRSVNPLSAKHNYSRFYYVLLAFSITCIANQDLQMFGLKLKSMSNFHPLEVVGRSSETHLEVGKIIAHSLVGFNFQEVGCSVSDRQGSNFESCVWRHPQKVILAHFSQ